MSLRLLNFIPQTTLASCMAVFVACGKPVIWTDQPAIREATGGIGIPVAPQDVDGIRAAMKRLIDNPEERADMGQAGREWVENNHSWDGVW